MPLTDDQIAANIDAWADFIAANPPPSPVASYDEWVAWNEWLRANFLPPFPDDE